MFCRLHSVRCTGCLWVADVFMTKNILFYLEIMISLILNLKLDFNKHDFLICVKKNSYTIWSTFPENSVKNIHKTDARRKNSLYVCFSINRS